MKKPFQLKVYVEPDQGGGQGPISPAGAGGPFGTSRIHILLQIVEQGPLRIKGLQDLRITLPPGAKPDAARVGIYQGDGMAGLILFLSTIRLRPAPGGTFAIDLATARAAADDLATGNTIGLDVPAPSGSSLSVSSALGAAAKRKTGKSVSPRKAPRRRTASKKH